MGIRVSITSEGVLGTEPEEIEITLEVDDKGGGGGSIQADVDSVYPTADFNYVANSASPTPDSTSNGDISWKDRVIPEAGAPFTYRLVCKEKSRGGLVTSKACMAGSTTNCATATVNVGC